MSIVLPTRARLVVKRDGHAITRQVPKPTIVVSMRERRPFSFDRFDNWFDGVVTSSLRVGHYSVQGLEPVIALERRSLRYLLVLLTQKRERFVRHCERLAKVPQRAILVEASWHDLKSPYSDLGIPSEAHPNAIVGSLIAIQTRWNIPIVAVSRNRQLCEEWAASWLSKAATYEYLESQGLGRVLQEGDL